MAYAISSRNGQRSLTLLLFLLVPTTLIVLFTLYPMFRLFQLSFTDWNGLDPSVSYVGLENYGEVIFDSPVVWKSLRNNMLYFVIHLLLIPLEIFIAYALDAGIRGSGFFKKLFFMPYIINGVAVSYMFAAIFAPAYSNGVLDMTLTQLGKESWIRGWLSDPSIVNFTLVFVSVWRFSGFHIVLFLAALQSLPAVLFEAADIEGASMFQKFRHIVLPGISIMVEVVLFLNVRGALQVFDIPFVMTSGGPGHASSTFSVFIIETAFKFNHVGKAACMSVLLFLIIIFIVQTQRLFFKRSE